MKARKKEITIEGVLYTHYTNQDGAHPVRLKVIADRKSRFYPILNGDNKIFLTPSQWENIISKRNLRGESKELLNLVKDAESRAREAKDRIMQNERPFDFSRFESEYFEQRSKKNIINLWESYLDDLLKEERIGTYMAYKNALQAFKYFRGMVTEGNTVVKSPIDLSPANLTVQVLKDFEKFLNKGRGKTTIGMYMRALKVIYNLAANDNTALKELDPFAKKQNDKTRYKIKTGSGSKGDALTLDELKRFIATDPIETCPEWEAKQFWLFSFYCQGMNFKDIALLEYKDIKGDEIHFIREKTKNTENKESLVKIPLTDPMREIIISLGNQDKKSYVFNILKKGMTPLEITSTYKQKIKINNKWTTRLCEENDLPPVKTYWARNTFATLLKFSGESIEVIRELLGHSDIRTTESYLKRFDGSRLKESHNLIAKLLKTA